MSFGIPEALFGTPWAVLGAFWAASRTPLMSPGGLLDAAGTLQDAPGPLWTALGPSWKPLGTIFEAPNAPKMRQVLQTQCSAWFSLAFAPECAKLQLMQLRIPGSTLIPGSKYMRQSNCRCIFRPLQQNERCSKAGRAPCKDRSRSRSSFRS